MDLVTVGVFSWAELEPTEGFFAFGWLRELLDLLGEAGIGVDLATPTASPPPWLSTRYPDVLPVNAAGARYTPRQPPALSAFAARLIGRWPGASSTVWSARSAITRP